MQAAVTPRRADAIMRVVPKFLVPMSDSKITSSSPASLIVFDSGIGGLSVADEIRRQLPWVNINYVADNRIFPYGLQEESVLIKRVCSIMPALEQRYPASAIVIACNSASTVVLDTLRQQTSTPVIGVVPAIKPAAQRSTNRVIGLLATPGTVNRHYTQRLIEEFASGCDVVKVGSSALVTLAENKLRGMPVDNNAIAEIVAPFLQHLPPPDVVVLGCTHFPFLRAEIAAALPSGTLLLDSGEAIARRTRQVLESHAIDNPAEKDRQKTPCLHFYFTEETPYAHQLAPALQEYGYAAPEFLQL